MGYQIVTYSPENFTQLILDHLSEHDNNDLPYAEAKCEYFISYFSNLTLKPNIILVENEYIDHDFTIDFSEYLSRCFKSYHKHCKRLHLFRIDGYKDGFFNRIILKHNKRQIKKLQSGYVGFITLKPLPLTCFGKTCLSNYGSGGGSRKYLIFRDYKVNLFGINLIIPRAMAWQEQDQVVGACATVALWTIFQCSGIKFNHYIPAPVEITRAATEGSQRAEKAFPNKGGLSLEEMASAIRQFSLEPLKLSTENLELFKGALNAYLSAGIPIILTIDLYNKLLMDNGIIRRENGHALAISGFRIRHSNTRTEDISEPLLKSSKISAIYVHDDNIGPYAKISIKKKKFKIKENDGTTKTVLQTVLTSKEYDNSDYYYIPDSMLIPIYHKIRIEYDDVRSMISGINYYLMHILNSDIGHYYDERLLVINLNEAIEHPIEWDIYLSDVSGAREAIRKQKLEENKKIDILTANMPKYIWIVSAYRNKAKIIDVLLDATDLQQSNNVLYVTVYDDNVKRVLDMNFIDKYFMDIMTIGGGDKIIKTFNE